MFRTLMAKSSLIAFACSISIAAHAFADAPKQIDVPAGDLAVALESVAKQADVQLVFRPAQLKGLRTRGVSGVMLTQDAVRKLLEGTDLQLRTDESTGAMMIAAPTPVAPKAETTEKKEPEVTEYEPTAGRGIPEILVEGSYILNMDIARSRDDAQPYVVFNRETIERSGATMIDDFLKTRLPMNTVGQSPGQNGRNTLNGSNSRVNLRGLGDNQTLILIDGHRATSTGTSSGPGQGDLNGIPIAAVERIEILPTTASGIYGGSATGGVVNVVLRRDYRGAELNLTYADTSRTDAASRRIDFAGGAMLEGDKTSVLFSASYSDADDLLMRDRDLIQRGRSRVLANNAAVLLGGSTPPLGSTTNIRSSSGANLTLKPAYGGANLRSPITYIPIGYAGVASDSGAALVANAGAYNFALADSAQNSGVTAGGRSSLVSTPTIESAMLTVRRRFTPNVQAFLDLSSANNVGRFAFSPSSLTFNVPVNAATNPFNQALTVTVPIDSLEGESVTSTFIRRLVTGVIVRLPHNWMAEVDATLGRSRFFNSNPDVLLAAAGNSVASGAIDVLRAADSYSGDFLQYVPAPATSGPFRTRQTNGALRTSGPVLTLPAGDLVLSGLVEYQRELQLESYSSTPRLGTSGYYPSRSQEIRSAYLETRIPVVGVAQKIPGVRSLDLQLAARYDEYSVNGVTSSITVGSTTPIVRETNELSSANPTLGLRWIPLEDVMVRASYGTGFLPPSVEQLIPRAATPVNWSAVTDPRRGNTALGTIPSTGGGNPDLRPEESKSWSAGLVYSPRQLPGLRFSVDYARISKTDNITLINTDLLQVMLNNEDRFPGRFARDAVAPGDPYGVGSISFIDGRSINLAQTEIATYDLALDYSRDTAALGSWDFFAAGTVQPHYQTRVDSSLPLVEGAGINGTTASIPLKLRANSGVTWRRGGLSLGWTVQYFDSYWARDPGVAGNAAMLAAQGNGGKVASQTFHDLMARYRLSQRLPSFLADSLESLEIQVGVRNVFDKAPAFDAVNQMGYYSYLGDPRLRNFYLTIKSAW